MRVEFTFDQALVEQSGYSLVKIYDAIKKLYQDRNISCVSDGEILAFEGGEHKDDYANLWVVIVALTEADWFMEFATSCIWYTDDDTYEDVLSQAKQYRANGGAAPNRVSVPEKPHLRVEFTFDQALVEQSGYSLVKIYDAIKKLYQDRNISCVSDGETLAFEGGEHKDDYANLWVVIIALTEADWFMEFATSCIWYADDDTYEDVLSQVKCHRAKEGFSDYRQ